MKDYKARIMIDNELKTITYKTSENPIEYLWSRYGMDSYIEYIKEVVG